MSMQAPMPTKYRFGDALARLIALHPSNDFGSDEQSIQSKRIALGTIQDSTPTKAG